jgi:hypothetical protein
MQVGKARVLSEKKRTLKILNVLTVRAQGRVDSLKHGPSTGSGLKRNEH